MGQHKTPLRYPGGKQRLSPFIEDVLFVNKITGHYVEPYAGGAGVAIELLLSNKVNHIHLNDSDFGIYAFWYSVIHKTEELCHLISTASLTIKEWRKRQAIVKKCDKRKILELGFSVFYLNRCNRSGVLSGGVIGGLEQKGKYKIDARFNRNDLITRIEAIAQYRDKISVTNFDAEFYIKNYIPNLPKNTLIYLDPPYYEKGSNLYLNFYKKSDHARIASIIQKEINQKWILSYDGVKDIINLYSKRRYFLYDLQYNAGPVYKGKEVFVLSDKLKLPTHIKLQHVAAGIKRYAKALS